MATFTLDESVFGSEGLTFQETIIEGRGRGIQLSWTQTGADQDLELLGFSVRFAAAEPEAKDTSAT